MKSEDYILNDIVEGEVGYIYLPQMAPIGESLEDDMKNIAGYIDTLKEHKAIVIDIRGNTGGNDNYWASVISKIIPNTYESGGYVLFRDSEVINNYIEKRKIYTKSIAELPVEVLDNAPKEVSSDFTSYYKLSYDVAPCNSIKFTGEIYLLTDRQVYSSAESFAIFCRENNLATIIGETTGGDGGGIDPVFFKLDNSGLIIRMAEDMFLTPEGICDDENKVKPDYIIEQHERTEDFNDDKCIQKVLELEKE